MSDQVKVEQFGLVSIVMPTFNQDQFISKAIQSVLDQTYENWELLVINNFSTDKTRDVALSFGDSRIKVIDFANHGIIASSRNFAVAQSLGDYIAFLDSDDYWTPEKLTKCIAKLAGGFDLVCHGEYFFHDGTGDFKPNKYGPEARCVFERMMATGNCLSTSAIVVKRSILRQVGVFDEDKKFNTAEDFDLWLRIVKAHARVGIIDEMLGYYRLHGASASASLIKNAKATLEVLQKHTCEHKLSIKNYLMALVYQIRIRFYIFRAEFRCR
jgi:teichuronic acid biosynthesis glycosyltransferase TuaG